MQNRWTYFRGDNRHPTNQGVFRLGLTVLRSARANVLYSYPPPPAAVPADAGGARRAGGWEPVMIDRGPDMVNDLESSSGVCITQRLDAAALFPVPCDNGRLVLNATTASTWIYMMSIDPATVYDTYATQRHEAFQRVDRYGQTKVQRSGFITAAWCLMGKEAAVQWVPPFEIIAAVSVIRNWAQPRGHDPNGIPFGTFTMNEIVPNLSCRLPDDLIDRLLGALHEVQSKSPYQLATVESGFRAPPQIFPRELLRLGPEGLPQYATGDAPSRLPAVQHKGTRDELLAEDQRLPPSRAYASKPRH